MLIEQGHAGILKGGKTKICLYLGELLEAEIGCCCESEESRYVSSLTLFVFDLSYHSLDITSRSKSCVICLNSRSSAITENSVVEVYLPGSQLP